MLEPSQIPRFPTTVYTPLTAATLPPYLAAYPEIAKGLGGKSCDWQADERGDGNLNLVFIVSGPAGQLVVKQALPYVRMVGDSWPLSLSRADFEQAALRRQAQCAPGLVPAVYGHDSVMALTIMEFLTPHVILRKGFIACSRFPHVGRQLGEFIAKTAFSTSDLHLPAAEKKRRMAEFAGNTAMCKITEDLIFDEPYFDAPLNRHTSPQLDAAALELRCDVELKLAVQAMKWRFLNQADCLVHGDLHTGSVMASADDTRVIDPEFAFYGPMGFDLGLLFGNFLLAYLAQPGQQAAVGRHADYAGYLLEQLADVWDGFRGSFAAADRARSEAAPCGDLHHPRLRAGAPAFAVRALEAVLERVWQDALGFAGCEMIRRIVGLAHVEDFESIAAPELRAACERRALRVARTLLLDRSGLTSMQLLQRLLAREEHCPA